MGPLLKGTMNKGHNTFNLSMKDKFCGPYRIMAIQFYLLKGTPFCSRVLIKYRLPFTLKGFGDLNISILFLTPTDCEFG